ncbi:Rv1733c family protein [Streptomyces sp. NPDC002817]|uniref:Rv1733c family protein n=1 Tax=Streptomyces sp. NPDC088357 TaxID=3154655 RepID=UPI00343541BC
MARTPRTGVRWWRWRRNPLKRRIDVVEAWLVLVMWLCATTGGLLAGLAAGITSAEYLERQRTERQQVSAVLLEDAKPRTANRVGRTPVWITVRWTGPDGTSHTGQTRVEPGLEAGARIMVWTNGKDRLTTRPLSSSAGVLQASATGVLAAACAISVVVGGGQAVHSLLNLRRLRQWDKAWAEADARWGGKTV